MGQHGTHVTSPDQPDAQYSTSALVLYDYMLTLPVEVAVFWNRKFTGVSALFFYNRYFSLLLFSANTHTIWLTWPTARGTIMV